MALDRKWVFVETTKHKALNSNEVRYWKSNLTKILKAGLEFEFNLPSQKGACKGDTAMCPCIHFKPENTCWTKCLNIEECKQNLGEEFKCFGIECSNFASPCVICSDFELDCLNCKFRYNPDKDPDKIRHILREELQPSKSYGKVNKYGVHDIVCDGSLLGKGKEGKGLEVLTTGRRIDYWEFYNMCKNVINKSKVKGAYVNERCSIHTHVLASYYNNGPASPVSELEKPMPQIILANLHQLCRKYQNAITWMSMGLDEFEHLTRWEKYRVSILDVSPIINPMPVIIDIMEERTNKARGKYGWINYMFIKFNPKGDLTRFHVEFRSMDGMMAPSPITALTCLFYALVIKAVEISRYGVLEIGPKEWFKKSLKLKDRLLNNMSGWNEGDRLSDTSELSDEDFETLTEESLDLINQVKHILFKIGPAYEVLEKLAYKPVAILRAKGYSWEDVEKKYKVFVSQENKIEKYLDQIIDTRELIGFDTEEQWTVAIKSKLKEEKDLDNDSVIDEIIAVKKNEGEYLWSNNLGTLLKV